MISNSALAMRPQPMIAVRHGEIWIGDLDGYLVVFAEPYRHGAISMAENGNSF